MCIKYLCDFKTNQLTVIPESHDINYVNFTSYLFLPVGLLLRELKT